MSLVSKRLGSDIVCSSCHTAKPCEEFIKRSNGKPGSWCRPCRKAYLLRYRAANYDRLKRSQQDYKKAHRNYFNEWEREQRAKDPTKNRERCRRYAQRHPERVKEQRIRKHARRKGATLTKVSYEAILARDGYICHLCEGHVYPEDLNYDHVVPLSRGGSHSEDNIKISHRLCNLRKGALPLAEAVHRIRALSSLDDRAGIRIP